MVVGSLGKISRQALRAVLDTKSVLHVSFTPAELASACDIELEATEGKSGKLCLTPTLRVVHVTTHLGLIDAVSKSEEMTKEKGVTVIQ